MMACVYGDVVFAIGDRGCSRLSTPYAEIERVCLT